MKAVALRTLADQDWKTQLARGYANIPVDAIVDVLNDNFTNFYGTWCEVEWNGNHYYVSRNDLGFLETQVEEVEPYQDDIYKYHKKNI